MRTQQHSTPNAAYWPLAWSNSRSKVRGLHANVNIFRIKTKQKTCQVCAVLASFAGPLRRVPRRPRRTCDATLVQGNSTTDLLEVEHATKGALLTDSFKKGQRDIKNNLGFFLGFLPILHTF